MSLQMASQIIVKLVVILNKVISYIYVNIAHKLSLYTDPISLLSMRFMVFHIKIWGTAYIVMTIITCKTKYP